MGLCAERISHFVHEKLAKATERVDNATKTGRPMATAVARLPNPAVSTITTSAVEAVLSTMAGDCFPGSVVVAEDANPLTFFDGERLRSER
jgi:hypothetical protein